MTRARTFKAQVRARMSKTGERYTTARRHLLTAATPPASVRPAEAARPRAAVTPPVDVRGAVADARVLERTGHSLSYWFEVLDRFGAAERGHTAAARHLREAHDVGSWYSQDITVAYERARGLRAVNQRTSGFAFGASKIVAAPVTAVKAAFTTPRRRAAWASALDEATTAALASGVGSGARNRFAARARGLACRFPCNAGIVEILLSPRTDGRTTVHVDHDRLPSRGAIETLRPQWKAALAALARAVEAAPAASPTQRPRAGARTATTRR
ncbi:MAG: hypothetical protein R2745_23535 [Vicinamibacterales bacterium]